MVYARVQRYPLRANAVQINRFLLTYENKCFRTRSADGELLLLLHSDKIITINRHKQQLKTTSLDTFTHWLN